MKTQIAAAVVLLGQLANAAVAGYSGTPFNIGTFSIGAKGESRLEAENFDRGGEGVAYHDADVANAGRQFRQTEGVDIGLCNDEGGGYRVGWIGSGEWLAYSVRIAEAGKYLITFRVSSRPVGSPGGKLHLEDESGTDLTGKLDVPGTADTWADLRTLNVALPAGEHVLKLVADVGGFNLNCVTFALMQPTGVPERRPGEREATKATGPAASEPVAQVAGVEAPKSNGLGAFAEQSNIGSSVGQVGCADTGVYTLSGGQRIGSIADAFHFVHSEGSGDGEIIAKVDSVKGTGSVGVMYRESVSANARFAAVLVTAGNGVSFARRSAQGAQAYSAIAPLAKPPVWVKLVRSGNMFRGLYAVSDTNPEGADWRPIGSARAVGMAAAVRGGLAVASGAGGEAMVSGVSTGSADVAGSPARPVEAGGTEAPSSGSSGTAVRPVGTGTGTPGAPAAAEGSFVKLSGKPHGMLLGVEARAKAFDGDPETFYESSETSREWEKWTGIDLGSPQRIRKIEFLPRAGHEWVMVGGVFEASPNPAFGGAEVVELHRITSAPVSDTPTRVIVDSGKPCRYFRFTGGDGKCMVAEISVFRGVATGQEKAPQTEKLPKAAAGASGDTAFTKLGGKTYEAFRSDAKLAELRTKAFDGDPATFFDQPVGTERDEAWTGLDLGTPKRIRKIEYLPRAGQEAAMVGGRFQAASNAVFMGGGIVDLYTVKSPPSAGSPTSVTVDSGKEYRYFRFVGGTGTCTVAEISVYGGTGGPAQLLAAKDAARPSKAVRKPAAKDAARPSSAVLQPAPSTARRPAAAPVVRQTSASSASRQAKSGSVPRPSSGGVSGGTERWGSGVTVQVAETRAEIIDLSQNALDWVQWGYEGNVHQRKAGVEAQIGDVELLGDDTVECVNSSKAGFSWSEGTPAFSAKASKAGVALVNLPGHTIQFRVRPLDTQPHTLVIYVGGAFSVASVSAQVPQGGYRDMRRGLQSEYFYTHVLSFRVAKPDDVLTVQLGYVGGAEGSVQLYAAQLR